MTGVMGEEGLMKERFVGSESRGVINAKVLIKEIPSPKMHEPSE